MKRIFALSLFLGALLFINPSAYAYDRGHGSRHDRNDRIAIKYGALILHDIIHSGCDHDNHKGRYSRHNKKHRGHVCRISYHDHGRRGHYEKYCYRH